MAELVFNIQAKNSLSQAVTDAATTLYLEDASTFIATGSTGDFYFAQLIGSDGTIEIVKVDVGNSTATSLSVTRGQEATSAQEWPKGTIIWQGITAETLDYFQQQEVARTGLFNPNGVLTSNYMGEKFYQSDDRLWWKAVAEGTQEWRLVAGVVYIADVTYSPSPGTHGLGTDLTMDTPGDPSADIYYTDDGTDPDTGDNLYSAPIAMPEGVTTYKARGFGSDRWESPSQNITSGEYTITAGFTGVSLAVNAVSGETGSPVLRHWATDGSVIWMMRTQTGGPSYLYSWNGSGSSWTLRDSTWPTNRERGIYMAVNSGTLYILTNYRGLLSWNGSNLVDEGAEVANNETPEGMFSLSNNLYVQMNYLGTDTMYRYDGGGSWTNLGASSNMGMDGVEDGGYWWSPYSNGLGRFNGTSWTTYAQSQFGRLAGATAAEGDIIGIGDLSGTDKSLRFDVSSPTWFIYNIHNYTGTGPDGAHYIDADNKVYYAGEDTNSGEWYKSSVESSPVTTYLGDSVDRIRWYPRLGSRYFGITATGELWELVNT